MPQFPAPRRAELVRRSHDISPAYVFEIACGDGRCFGGAANNRGQSSNPTPIPSFSCATDHYCGAVSGGRSDRYPWPGYRCEKLCRFYRRFLGLIVKLVGEFDSVCCLIVRLLGHGIASQTRLIGRFGIAGHLAQRGMAGYGGDLAGTTSDFGQSATAATKRGGSRPISLRHRNSGMAE